VGLLHASFAVAPWRMVICSSMQLLPWPNGDGSNLLHEFSAVNQLGMVSLYVSVSSHKRRNSPLYTIHNLFGLAVVVGSFSTLGSGAFCFTLCFSPRILIRCQILSLCRRRLVGHILFAMDRYIRVNYCSLGQDTVCRITFCFGQSGSRPLICKSMSSQCHPVGSLLWVKFHCQDSCDMWCRRRLNPIHLVHSLGRFVSFLVVLCLHNNVSFWQNRPSAINLHRHNCSCDCLPPPTLWCCQRHGRVTSEAWTYVCKW